MVNEERTERLWQGEVELRHSLRWKVDRARAEGRVDFRDLEPRRAAVSRVGLGHLGHVQRRDTLVVDGLVETKTNG